MSEKLFDLFVRSESEDDVASPSPQSSLKSFRDTFKRSDSSSSQTVTGATSSCPSNVSKKRGTGKSRQNLSLFWILHGLRVNN